MTAPLPVFGKVNEAIVSTVGVARVPSRIVPPGGTNARTNVALGATIVVVAVSVLFVGSASVSFSVALARSVILPLAGRVVAVRTSSLTVADAPTPSVPIVHVTVPPLAGAHV